MSPGRTSVKKKTNAETVSSVTSASARREAVSLKITCETTAPGPREAARAPGCYAVLALAANRPEVGPHDLDPRRVAAAVRAEAGDGLDEDRDDLAALEGQDLHCLPVEREPLRRVDGRVRPVEQRVERRVLPVRLGIRRV